MPGDPNGVPRLVPAGDPLRKRIRYLPDADPSAIQGIRCGVLFVMAWWSGPARLAWASLKKTLNDLDPTGQLDVIVADIDGLTGFETTRLGLPIHGCGETTWIKGGQPLTTAWISHPDEVRRHTARLMELCQTRTRSSEATNGT